MTEQITSRKTESEQGEALAERDQGNMYTKNMYITNSYNYNMYTKYNYWEHTLSNPALQLGLNYPSSIPS